MKIIKIFLFTILLCVPTTVFAEECNINSIQLESIELKSKSDTAKEIEASVENNKINIDAQLQKVGDSIEYNIKLKNNSNEDFFIDNSNLKSTNNYISYEVTYDDNTNKIKAKKEKEISIKAEYIQEIPENSFNDNNTFSTIILNEDPNNIVNPMTFNSSNFVILLIIVLLVSAIILIKYKKTKSSIILLVLTLLIPITVSALCKTNIEIKANIKIIKDIAEYPEGKTKSSVVTGDLVKIGAEEFYVVSNDGEDLVLLAQYNLNVGNNKKPDAPVGIQDSDVRGSLGYQGTRYGNVFFSETAYWSGKIGTEYPGEYCTTYTPGMNCAYVYDSNSNLYHYVEAYKEYLIELGEPIKEARLLKIEEAYELGCSKEAMNCDNAPSWVSSTSYWLGSVYDMYGIWRERANNTFYYTYSSDNAYHGVRPVIVI